MWRNRLKGHSRRELNTSQQHNTCIKKTGKLSVSDCSSPESRSSLSNYA